MLAKISKCLCRNLFIGAAAQIRAVYKDHKILVVLKKCINLSSSFQTHNNIAIQLVYIIEQVFSES